MPRLLQTCMRTGCTAEQASASQQQLQAHAQQADGLDSASLLQLGARWRVLTAEGACAQSALSPEAALLAERQVNFAPRKFDLNL